MFSSAEEPLLTVNGEVLLTARDFIFAEKYDTAFNKLLKRKVPKKEELFIALAEQAMCALFAEKYGVNADAVQIGADYALFLSDLTEEDAEYKCIEQVKEELGMNDKAFEELFVLRAYRSDSAKALVSDIAALYTNTVDAAAMEEHILLELYALEEAYDITVAFPEMEGHIFSYESVLEL